MEIKLDKCLKNNIGKPWRLLQTLIWTLFWRTTKNTIILKNCTAILLIPASKRNCYLIVSNGPQLYRYGLGKVQKSEKLHAVIKGLLMHNKKFIKITPFGIINELMLDIKVFLINNWKNGLAWKAFGQKSISKMVYEFGINSNLKLLLYVKKNFLLSVKVIQLLSNFYFLIT